MPIPLSFRPPYGIRSARNWVPPLMLRLPESTSSANLIALSRFSVKIAAESPKRVSFANSMASSMPDTGVTPTAGPNNSSREKRMLRSTSASIAGRTTAPSLPPPATSRAPAPTASWIQLSTRAASLSRTIGPTFTVSLIGSPVERASTLGARASRKSLYTDLSTMTRWVEMHTWPALE